MGQHILYTKQLQSPLGNFLAAASNRGICMLEFGDRKELESESNTVKKLLNVEIEGGESPFFPQLEEELNAYFEGKLKVFQVPLHYPGTPFQQAVWSELLNIPYGKTRSYMQQAKALKNPDGIRAVAHANGTNRMAILIPCHRVIGTNGSLTGYGGGLWRKKWLLNLEAKYSGQTELGFFSNKQIANETVDNIKPAGISH